MERIMLRNATPVQKIDDWSYEHTDGKFKYKTTDLLVHPTTFEPVARFVLLPEEDSPEKTAFILEWC